MMATSNRRVFRRQQIDQALRDGESRESVAQRFGLSVDRVAHIANEIGLKNRPGRPRSSGPPTGRWASIDWALSDRQIADALGVTRQAVNVVRHRIHKTHKRTAKMTGRK